MNLPRLIAALAIIIALLWAGWVVTTLVDETSLGPARTKDTALPAFVATMPRVGDFRGEFNINEVNPFVPFEVSQRAEVEIKGPGKPKPQEGTKPPPPPPQGPAVVEGPKQPVYPTRKAKDIGAPECLGVVRKGDTAVLVAQRPGEEKVNLVVGDVINGWTLREIGMGVASFTDPAGELHELPVGAGDGTQASAAAPLPQPAPKLSASTTPPAGAAPLRPGQSAPPSNGPGPVEDGMRPRPAPEMTPLRPRPK